MTVGVIAELNPFHYGHQKLLHAIRKKYQDATIVMVLSGHFQQRGIPSVIDKWTKTEIALAHDVDLVVELPFVFATQGADVFATGAIALLKALQVDVLAFGSESNDLEGLKALVNAQEDENFNALVQVFLRMGYNYPTSLSKALLELTGKTYQLPNDLLAISYLKAMKQQQAPFEIFMIQRENNYHEEDITVTETSASSIRAALKKGQSLKGIVPQDVEKALCKQVHFQDDYFPFLRYQILSEPDLTRYLGVDSSLAKKLKEKILEAENYQDYIQLLHSKNYTYNCLSRTLLHILVRLTKEEAKQMKTPQYLRILGMTDRGRQHLNRIKKSCSLPIISKFKREHRPLLALEIQSTMIYALPLEAQERNQLIKKEYRQAPIRKE